LIKDIKCYTRAKHIEIRYFYIRNDIVHRKRLYVEHIPSKDQVADILIKQLPYEGHWRHAQAIGLNKPLEKEEKVELAIEDDFDDVFEDDSDIYNE
jgi:hypothetical protein